MPTSRLKIATLNTYRYYDWDLRYDQIKSTLKEYSPDIVALQEVQINPSFSQLPSSLVIARSSGYKYHIFSPTTQKYNQISKEGEFNQTASHGLAIISKFPIISSESTFLKRQEGDKELRSVLLTSIDVNGKKFDVCNVHFENSSAIANLQLSETLNILNQKNVNPIILGDFNLYEILSDLDELDKYMISTDIEKYISYPKDNGTLDYIISPISMPISKIECPEYQLSDHRIVIADILI